jgi:uncharacterized protein YggE
MKQTKKKTKVVKRRSKEQLEKEVVDLIKKLRKQKVPKKNVKTKNIIQHNKK